MVTTQRLSRNGTHQRWVCDAAPNTQVHLTPPIGRLCTFEGPVERRHRRLAGRQAFLAKFVLVDQPDRSDMPMRWWEFYFIRYAMGTVVGALILFYLSPENSALHRALFEPLGINLYARGQSESNSVDVARLVLLASYLRAGLLLYSQCANSGSSRRPFPINTPSPDTGQEVLGVEVSHLRSSRCSRYYCHNTLPGVAYVLCPHSGLCLHPGRSPSIWSRATDLGQKPRAISVLRTAR